MKNVYNTIKAYAITFFLLLLASNLSAQTPQHSKNGSTGTSGIFLNSTSAFKIQEWYNPTDLSPVPTSGLITKIYFKSTTANQSGTYTNFELSFKQPSSGTGFASTTFETGLTPVLSSPSQVLTGNSVANGWFAITLATPFFYDNTKPLVFEIKFTARTGGISTWASGGTGIKKLYSSSPTATTGTNHTTFWQDFGFDLLAYQNNASVSAIPQPGPDICVGTHTVTTQIKNAGANAINNVRVNWSVNGVPQPFVNYTTPLAIGATSAPITLGNIPMINPVATNTIRVWTSLPNGVTDPQPEDDTLTIARKPHDLPNAVIYYPTTRLCPGDSVLLQAGTGSNYTYIWQFNADPIAIPNTQSAIYAKQDGYYSVKVFNPGCNLQAAPVQITVKPLEIDLGPDLITCEKKPAIVLDAGEPGSRYIWSTGDTTQTIQTKEGVNKYWVEAKLGQNCMASDTVNMTIDPLPRVNGISYVNNGSTYTFSPAGVFFTDTYLWDFGDGGTDTAMTATHTFSVPPPYNVTLKVFNSCGVMESKLAMALGVNEVAKNNTINIYPNPAQSSLNIATDGSLIKDIKIYNAIGAVVLNQKVDNRANITADIPHLSNGNYSIVINTSAGTIHKLFQVSK